MKIVALIGRHQRTILVGSDPRKGDHASMVEKRSDAHGSE
jgi:hypothetical protein